MSASTQIRRPVQPQSEPKTNAPGSAQNTSQAQSGENSTQEQIAKLAYVLWEGRGRVEGSPEKDWFEAERQLLGTSKS